MTDAALMQDVIAEGGRKMDLDLEIVQVTAIICATVIGVVALVYDGELGYAMGTGILTLGGSMVGYLFGKKECEKEVRP